jgi:hypothetical protein
VAAVVAGEDQLSCCKITYYKLWPLAAGVEEEQAIKAVVVIVLAHTVKLMLDTTAKQEQVIQLMVVAAVVVAVDIMVALEVAATAAHMVGIQEPAIQEVKQEILVPAGVLLIQMGLHPMVELLAGNRVLLCRIMWDWVDQLDVPAATDI